MIQLLIVEIRICWCKNLSPLESAGVEADEVAIEDLQNKVSSGAGGGVALAGPSDDQVSSGQQEWSARNEFRSLEKKRRA